MTNRFFLIFLVTMFVCQNGDAQVHTLDLPASTISFIIENFGMDVSGKFSQFSGTLEFNPNHPETSKFVFQVDPNSITTGIGLRDKHLKNEKYFNAEKFKIMNFKSTSVEKNARGEFVLTGVLTIKNISQTIQFPFTAEKKPNGIQFLGSFRIDRNDFLVGGKNLTMGDSVFVTVKITTLHR